MGSQIEDIRQVAFQKLRPACVELSSVALKFRGKQATVKSVTQALEQFYGVLEKDFVAQNLNERLAEYAFFPLTHIFNESQRLSSRCLELAVLSLQILVAQGWRKSLSPEMGKQLLLLLTLLAGGMPGKNQREKPTDDLEVAAFNCIWTVVTMLGVSPRTRSIFHDVGIPSLVDQLVFLLLEAISDNTSDKVQLAASRALLQIEHHIEERLVLASLLPRTVSILTKVLRPSTQQRRTARVLEANLDLLRVTLQRNLNDQVAPGSPEIQNVQPVADGGPDEDQDGASKAPTQAWRKATSAQVKLALTNVVQLRKHDRPEVRRGLWRLCMMVLEECCESLAECASVMLETLLSLTIGEDTRDLVADLKHLLMTNPSLEDELNTSLQKWMSSLPRLMQSNDDRPRLNALAQISGGIQLLAHLGHNTGSIHFSLPVTLMDSVVGALQSKDRKLITTGSEPASSISQLLATSTSDANKYFQPVVLFQQTQQASLIQLHSMITSFAALEQAPRLTRVIIDTVPVTEGDQQLSAMWIALRLLENMPSDVISDFVTLPESSSELSTSTPCLISDLYSYILPLLDPDDLEGRAPGMEWQAQALALECLILQARQLGISYRPELMDSLYPVLSSLGSQNGILQQHAMTALNLLAMACQYASVTDMLVDNVDYLVNSIALKLNSSNLSPQAPRILLVMVRLCGARLIPYLDDLVGSVFVALDDFHGYPQLVEVLFEILSAIVDEGAKLPYLAITKGKEATNHQKTAQKSSDLHDILEDLSSRKSRKRKLVEDDGNQAKSAPRRPFSDELDGPTHEKSFPHDTASAHGEGENENMPLTNTSDEKTQALSKTHQLLLNIGQATTPHLSSPSPKVRHMLLELLNRIAPLLAKDEDSFLPLINAVWPSLTARLFGEVMADGDGEAAFNVCAAAETIAKLCEGAGDFLGSRIEDVFPQLLQLWKSTWKKVSGGRARTVKKTADMQSSNGIAAAVDLQLVNAPAKDHNVSKASLSQFGIPNRTTDAQMLNALITLLSSILSHVRITDDNGDTILSMLAPIIDQPGRENVRQALEIWNSDAVWLLCERSKIEHEMAEGARSPHDWTWTPSFKGSHADSLTTCIYHKVVF